MTNKKLVLVFSTVFVVFLALAAILTNIQPEESVAVISVNGKSYSTVLLDKDDTFTVDTEYGKNTVEVKDGNIRVISADCPDGLCMRHGKLHSKYDSIVCLPNKLVIEYKTDGDNQIVAGRK